MAYTVHDLIHDIYTYNKPDCLFKEHFKGVPFTDDSGTELRLDSIMLQYESKRGMGVITIEIMTDRGLLKHMDDEMAILGLKYCGLYVQYRIAQAKKNKAGRMQIL